MQRGWHNDSYHWIIFIILSSLFFLREVQEAILNT